MSSMTETGESSEPSEDKTSGIPYCYNVQLSKSKLAEETNRSRENDYSNMEWTFYPSSGNRTYHTGKKCIFDGVHLRTKTSSAERTLQMCLGKKKYVTEIDSRNGIPSVTPGDHPYEYPEQSTDFYKLGATRAPVNFGSATFKKKSDTFIPLQRLPLIPCVPFRIKEKQLELEKEKLEVKNLDLWKPAPTLMQSLLPTGMTRRLTLPN